MPIVVLPLVWWYEAASCWVRVRLDAIQRPAMDHFTTVCWLAAFFAWQATNVGTARDGAGLSTQDTPRRHPDM